MFRRQAQELDDGRWRSSTHAVLFRRLGAWRCRDALSREPYDSANWVIGQAANGQLGSRHLTALVLQGTISPLGGYRSAARGCAGPEGSPSRPMEMKGKNVMTDTSSVEPACASCAVTPPGFFERYRGFLLSPGTLITAANALLLLLGFVAGLAGQPQAGRWLYLASAIIGGAPIFKLAAGNILRRFDLTAGVMVSIAMIAAMIIGEYSAAALVAFMMLVGEMLENLTMAHADNALKELASLVPDTVTLRRDGQDIDVPIQAVRAGDVVLVRPGGRIPVDGRVRSGHAAVDQAAITGESMPLDKGAGDSVFAGTLASGGALEIEVDKVGRETTLGYMLRLVEEVRSTQAPVQRVANRYAQYMTPMALAIAVVTYLLTRDITRSITVLVVICPCSLVLATPTAIVAAIGNAARRGILVKHGAAMEQIGRVDVVAFDKTGTLTLGEPQVTATVALNGFDERELLALAASAERSSEHPLARAIVAAARREGLEPVAPDRSAERAGARDSGPGRRAGM